MGKTQKTREIPLVHFDCPTGQLTLGNVQALGHLQLSITAIACLLATFSLKASIFYWAVGLLIFWRKSGEWMDLIFSLACILMGAINMFGFPVAQTLSFNRRFCKCEEAWFCSGLNVKEKGLAHFLGFRVIDRPDGEAWFCGEISRRIEMVA